MGPFPSSEGNTHILVAVDYVTKWVEAIPTKSDDHKTSMKMLKQLQPARRPTNFKFTIFSNFPHKNCTE